METKYKDDSSQRGDNIRREIQEKDSSDSSDSREIVLCSSSPQNDSAHVSFKLKNLNISVRRFLNIFY